MTLAVRRFALSAWLSYRALFTWLNPWGYTSSRIVQPVCIGLLFIGLARSHHNNESINHHLTGTALIIVGMAAVIGVNLAVANERVFGTLSAWLSSPQGLLSSLLGKASVHLLDGMLGATLMLVTCRLIFGLSLPWSEIPTLIVIAFVAAVSASGLGIAVSAFSVRYRDVFTAPNVAVSVLVGLSGALVPAAELPANLDVISAVLPLSHAVLAAEEVVFHGGSLSASLLAQELFVGLVWGTLGYFWLRVLIAKGRRDASFELV